MAKPTKSPKIKETKENLQDPVYLTFFATFLFLSGTTFITLLASLSANDLEQVYLKQALVSETAVNMIASVTYYYFMVYLYADKLTLENITSIRYLDWAFTTPLLLVSFVLYTEYSSKPGERADFIPLIYIIILNLGMLLFGYLGETKRMNYWGGLILGFICYAVLMYFLYEDYVKGTSEGSITLFSIFALIWGLYGLSYLLPTRLKNIAYNILDLISKAGFGVFIWFKLIASDPTQRLAVDQ